MKLLIITTSTVIYLLWILLFTANVSQALTVLTPGEHYGEQEINKRGGLCSDQFKECVNKYFSHFDDFQVNYTAGATINIEKDSLDVICSKADLFQECLENQRKLCQNDRYWGPGRVNYYKTLQIYLCSLDGRAAFTKTNGSRCDKSIGTDRLRAECERSTLKSYQLKKKLLNKDSLQQQETHCQYLQEYRDCSVKSIKQGCGEAIAEFISKFDIVMNKERYAFEKEINKC